MSPDHVAGNLAALDQPYEERPGDVEHVRSLLGRQLCAEGNETDRLAAPDIHQQVEDEPRHRGRQIDNRLILSAVPHAQRKGTIATGMASERVQSFQRLQANANPGPVGLAQLPQEIRRKFVSDRGRFLLQIHPAVDIWDREGAERFVGELRGVDPDVTGTPIITYEAIRLMERAYLQGTIYAVVLVSAVTALVIRRVRETVLALIPEIAFDVGCIEHIDDRISLPEISADAQDCFVAGEVADTGRRNDPSSHARPSRGAGSAIARPQSFHISRRCAESAACCGPTGSRDVRQERLRFSESVGMGHEACGPVRSRARILGQLCGYVRLRVPSSR